VEAGDFGGAGLVGPDHDVVAVGIGGPEADDPLGREPFLLDDPLQHRLRVLEQILRRLADDLVLQDQRIAADQFPAGEEGRPVDVVGEVLQIPAVEGAHAEEGRLAGQGSRRLGPEAVLPRGGQ
jgi:hypothetical protein